MRRTTAIVLAAGMGLLGGCGEDTAEDPGVNPFLEDQSNPGKEDTAYLNPDGIEVEVDLEADVEAPDSRKRDAPADLGQFAVTYLRRNGQFYLESLAEDASSDARAEWLVDGEWITAAAARAIEASRLTRFRIRGVNAVLLHRAATGVTEGSVFHATVPVRPYAVMTEGGANCTEPDDHMGLDASIYWYLWDPDRSGCAIQTQQATLTVSRMIRADRPAYPEYDRLTADGRVTAVILFGQIGDDPLTDSDSGVRGLNRMVRWLTDAGFGEALGAPVGRRFTKRIAAVGVEIDLYSPYDFSGLGDFAHFANFQRALSEHEIVVYDGHSMLGASDFWSRPTYLDFYQVFLYGGCLGYEYYVRPIVAGKGGWENVDIMSSVVEVSAGATEFAGPWLAKLFWALEHDFAAAWSDLLIAVRRKVGDSTFGASGVRDNCFSPGGSYCSPTPDPGTSRRYESGTPVPIPDNAPDGVESVIEVTEPMTPGRVSVELAVTHTWVGDLRIELTHGGTTAVLWDRAGGSTRDIRQTIAAEAFHGGAAAGLWTLRVRDLAARDTGTIDRWTIVLEP
jgi:hypothetical protein